MDLYIHWVLLELRRADHSRGSRSSEENLVHGDLLLKSLTMLHARYGGGKTVGKCRVLAPEADLLLRVSCCISLFYPLLLPFFLCRILRNMAAAKSIWSRKLDLVYLVFFITHVPIMLSTITLLDFPCTEESTQRDSNCTYETVGLSQRCWGFLPHCPSMNRLGVRTNADCLQPSILLAITHHYHFCKQFATSGVGILAHIAIFTSSSLQYTSMFFLHLRRSITFP